MLCIQRGRVKEKMSYSLKCVKGFRESNAPEDVCLALKIVAPRARAKDQSSTRTYMELYVLVDFVATKIHIGTTQDGFSWVLISEGISISAEKDLIRVLSLTY